MSEPAISSSSLSSEINERFKRPVSGDTIRRKLRSYGLKCYRSVQKRYLTKKMKKKKRLDWCKKQESMPLSYWEKVVFSDETIVAINLNSVMNTIRRYSWQNPLQSKFLRPSVKFPLK